MKNNRIAADAHLRDLAFVALMAAVISICAWIQIPAAVPYTLQTFGVYCAVGLLGGKLGTIAVSVYLLIGAFGAPVFSGFSGGLSKLTGPTGGYLIGFLFAALIYWGVTKLFGDSHFVSILAMILGNLVIYAFGTVWFMLVSPSKPGFVTALTLCVLPYILSDLLKIVLAHDISMMVRDRLRARNIL